MTVQEINQMLGEIGLPYAYYQFDEGTGQEPPFICWYIEGINDLYADNINYQGIGQLTVELYTDAKDFALETVVEQLFAAHGMSYAKDGTFIDSERMHETIYTTEVIINAE